MKPGIVVKIVGKRFYLYLFSVDICKVLFTIELMGRVLLHILVMISVLFSFDCSKLMLLGYECPKMEHSSVTKAHPPCHSHKTSNKSEQKNNCNCEKTQLTILENKFETQRPELIVLNFILLYAFSGFYSLEKPAFYAFICSHFKSLPSYSILTTTTHLLI